MSLVVRLFTQRGEPHNDIFSKNFIILSARGPA